MSKSSPCWTPRSLPLNQPQGHFRLSSCPCRPRSTDPRLGTSDQFLRQEGNPCHSGKGLCTLSPHSSFSRHLVASCVHKTTEFRAAEDKQRVVLTLKLWGNSWWYHNKRQKTREACPNHTANSRRDVHPTAGGAQSVRWAWWFSLFSPARSVLLRPRQQAQRRVRTDLSSSFHPLGAAGPGQPLRMFACCGVGRTVRKSPSWVLVFVEAKGSLRD